MTGQRMTVLSPTHERADMSRTLLTAASSAGTAALLVFAVSACGGSSTPSATTPTAAAQQQSQSAGPGFGAGGGQGFPGASGKVAAISGTTLQVQSAQTGQVAVTYTAKTTFTEAVKASGTAVKVGTCVNVRSTPSQSTTTATTGPVTAASVQLSNPVNGECGVRGGGGFGGFGGGGFGGAAGGTRPSGAPTGAPGAGRGQRGGFGGARPVSGRVTAVDGSTITVAAVSFGGGRGAGGTASPAATPSTSPVQVTTSSTTTYTKTVSAAAKDLAVGQCVTAIGKASDTGAVTATVIASQPAVNGECSTGFGAGRQGAGSGGAGGTS
jgi:Domain of unknown function (DUF5666)